MLVLGLAMGSADASEESGRAESPAPRDRDGDRTSQEGDRARGEEKTPKPGPFVLADGKSGSLKLGFAMQLQFFYEREETPAGPVDNHRLRFRRLRFGLGGDLLGDRLAYKVQLNVSPGSLELLDGWAEAALTGDWRIRLGQFHIPYTRYRTNSFSTQQLADWSIVTEYFGAERQFGAALHNGWRGSSPISVRTGIYSGVNARASHGLGPARVYRAPRPSPSALTSAAPPARIHPELVANVAWLSEGIDVYRYGDARGGPPRASLGLSAAWDLRPEATQDTALRLAAEGLLKLWGVSLSATGYAASLPSTGRDGWLWGIYGLNSEVSWRLHPRVDIAARAATIRVDEAVRQDAAALIAARDDLPADGAQLRYARQDELTTGLNVYLAGHKIKWQTDVSWFQRHPAERDGVDDDWRIRSHFLLKF